MSLDDLRRAHRPDSAPRVAIHGGSCGEASGASRYARLLAEHAGGALFEVVEAACDGACWAAPAATVLRDRHRHRFARLDESGIEPVVRCLGGDCDGAPTDGGQAAAAGEGSRTLLPASGSGGGLADALEAGAYSAAARALAMPPEEAIETVEALGLTGRGGAHFPTASKWRFAAAHGEPLLVVNAEEGEPGVFKDRHLLEGAPHRLVEGMLIAAHAVGARQAFVYVNGQAHRARAAIERALAEARAAGILDGDALGRRVDLAVEVRSGAGGYVCGEETVILNSIEGERPVPRFKPPQITETGLFGRPTLLNNVETLAAATALFDRPPAPVKLVSLSGAVPRPGVYEVAVDGQMTWAALLARAGAEPSEVQALLAGGPSGEFIPRVRLGDALEMRALGAGGIVALGLDADIASVTRELAAYNARESCGECTPCREGTRRLVDMLAAPAPDRRALDVPALEGLIEVMSEASLCALGGMAGRPVLSALQHFPGAFGAGE